MSGSSTGVTTGLHEVYDLAGAIHRVVLDGASTGGAAAVIEVTLLPGAAIPPHSDAREDLVWHVVDGAVELGTAEGERTLEAGASAFVARGGKHAVVNRGTSEAKVLMVAHPAGIEAFVREAATMLPSGVPAAPPPPEAIEAFAEMAARHGVTLYEE